MPKIDAHAHQPRSRSSPVAHPRAATADRRRLPQRRRCGRTERRRQRGRHRYHACCPGPALRLRMAAPNLLRPPLPGSLGHADPGAGARHEPVRRRPQGHPARRRPADQVDPAGRRRRQGVSVPVPRQGPRRRAAAGAPLHRRGRHRPRPDQRRPSGGRSARAAHPRGRRRPARAAPALHAPPQTSPGWANSRRSSAGCSAPSRSVPATTRERSSRARARSSAPRSCSRRSRTVPTTGWMPARSSPPGWSTSSSATGTVTPTSGAGRGSATTSRISGVRSRATATRPSSATTACCSMWRGPARRSWSTSAATTPGCWARPGTGAISTETSWCRWTGRCSIRWPPS